MEFSTHIHMGSVDQKIVLVTRLTQLAALQHKFNTRSQAKFQIVSSKKRQLAQEAPAADSKRIVAMAEQAFDEVDSAARTYDDAVRQIRHDLDLEGLDLPVQTVDRDFLPNFVFGPSDIVVTVGQDGLVANTAKYALGLPIVAVNPDPQRIDGVLLPFLPHQARDAVRDVLRGKARYREVTLAEAALADGQHMLAFNELFIGTRTHVSARYRLTVGGRSEPQSSSGMLVCTGAGSTGWLSSVFNMTAGVAAMLSGGRGFVAPPPSPMQLKWEDPRLVFVVREPFVSKTSRAQLVAGIVEPDTEIIVESDMASGGILFSDGVESDAIEFNAGATASIRAAGRRAKLVV